MNQICSEDLLSILFCRAQVPLLAGLTTDSKAQFISRTWQDGTEARHTDTQTHRHTALGREAKAGLAKMCCRPVWKNTGLRAAYSDSPRSEVSLTN